MAAQTQIGLDIGYSSIKIVEVEKKKKGLYLSGLGQIATPVNVNSQAEGDKRKLIIALKKLIKEVGLKNKQVVIGLPESAVFSQIIEMPSLEDQEVASALQFEAEQYIPVPLGEVELEYLVLSSDTESVKSKKMEVLLTAGKKKEIQRRVEIVEEAGLEPLVLETEVLSFIRVVKSLFSKRCLLLDLGHHSSQIAVLNGQRLEIIRNINTGGEALTRALARDLDMEYMQAEQYKTAYGIDDSVLEGKVAQALLPTFNLILSELQKSLGFFRQSHPNVMVPTLLTSGGGAMMAGLNSYLAQSLNMEVVTIDPFKSFSMGDAIDKINNKPQYTVAVGLAMREVK